MRQPPRRLQREPVVRLKQIASYRKPSRPFPSEFGARNSELYVETWLATSRAEDIPNDHERDVASNISRERWIYLGSGSFMLARAYPMTAMAAAFSRNSAGTILSSVSA